MKTGSYTHATSARNDILSKKFKPTYNWGIDKAFVAKEYTPSRHFNQMYPQIVA